jgi:hypothetical protein
MKRIAFALVLVCIAAVPVLAAPIGPEITIPAAGRVILPGITYYTEVTITNHRDVKQAIAIEFIGPQGPASLMQIFELLPHQSIFAPHGFISTSRDYNTGVGAMRFTAITTTELPDDFRDPADFRDLDGRLEVKAFVVKERGPFGLYGASRQEIEGVPLGEYTAKENIFVGVLHQPPTYTNVGIVNLHPTETVTFFVEYEFMDPVAITVPPMSTQQLRVTGGGARPGEPGNAGRSVIVRPEWAGDGSGRTTPWVAYASTIDGITGDAFSGVRLPVGSVFRQR